MANTNSKPTSKNQDLKSDSKTKELIFPVKTTMFSLPFLPNNYTKNLKKYLSKSLKNKNRDLEFEKILKMEQQKLKAYCYETLKGTNYNPISADGFLYARGKLPIMLVAHMDTVHAELPKDIIYHDSYVTSPQGIGGDDRCGIFMALEIAKELKCHILFTEDEEIGCVGAEKFAKSKFAEELNGKLNYIIEMDRRGENDAVFYYCGNDDFKEFVEENSIFEEEFGSYSDICEIAPKLDASAVNISCGYFQEHTKSEYINMEIMKRNIEEIKKLISSEVKERFEWKEKKWRGYGSNYYDDYGEFLYKVFYNDYSMYEYVEANSDAEAVGKFLMDHPRLSYNDIFACAVDEYDDESYEGYYKWY